MVASGPSLRCAVLAVLAARSESLVKWEEPLASDELPTSGFPGASAADSNDAFPRGVQPKSLEAWPRLADGSLASCWKRTIIHDIASGWPGRCLGLNLLVGVTSQNECAARCAENPLFPMWQVTHLGECYQGLGTNCESREGDLSFDVLGAQRIQHGHVTVLQSMEKYEVANLRTIGIFNVGNGTDGVHRCRSLCYSNLKCTLWQYGANGCMVQDDEYVGTPMQYPLTTLLGGADSTSEVARTMRASEFIQHYCPPIPAGAVQVNAAVNYQDDAAASSGSIGLSDSLRAWWWWPLGGVLLAVVLASCLWCLCMKTPGKKKRTTGRSLVMDGSSESLRYDRSDLDEDEAVESSSELETSTPLVQSPATLLRPTSDSLGSFGSDYRPGGSIVAPMQQMSFSPNGSGSFGSASFGYREPPLSIPNVTTGTFPGGAQAMRLPSGSSPGSFVGSTNGGGSGSNVRFL